MTINLSQDDVAALNARTDDLLRMYKHEDLARILAWLEHTELGGLGTASRLLEGARQVRLERARGAR